MYPQRELTRLAVHKAVLRERIGVRREACAAALSGVLRPVAWLDRAVVLWRKIAPFARLATIPLTLLFQRTFLARMKIPGPLLRWGPLIFGAVRSLNRR